jgi:isopentenyl-diphosphate Delta-isomerase
MVYVTYNFGKYEMSKINIVDENDNVIGEETRENIHKNGLLHREIHVWVFNDKREIIFQKRSENKDTNPGLLDASFGGHVEIGETYEDAAIKELKEETGIETKKSNLIFITKMKKHGTLDKIGMTNNVFRAVYAYRYNGDISSLKIEDGMATSLEFWPIDKILNLTESEKKEFIPALVTSEVFFDIYRKIKNLIKYIYGND